MPDALILLCAGSGSRMRGSVNDKILEPVRGKPVLRYSIDAALAAGGFAQWIFVVRDDAQSENIAGIVSRNLPGDTQVTRVRGGAARQDSVYAGLRAVNADAGLVFIHDAARPCIQPSILNRLREVARADGNATLAHRVVDTIKQVAAETDAPRRQALHHLDRERLWAMETPQVFRPGEILEAYRAVIESGETVTDDTAALAAAGRPVSLVENPYPNPKLTRPLDLAWIELLWERGAFPYPSSSSSSFSSS